MLSRLLTWHNILSKTIRGIFPSMSFNLLGSEECIGRLHLSNSVRHFSCPHSEGSYDGGFQTRPRVELIHYGVKGNCQRAWLVCVENCRMCRLLLFDIPQRHSRRGRTKGAKATSGFCRIDQIPHWTSLSICASYFSRYWRYVDPHSRGKHLDKRRPFQDWHQCVSLLPHSLTMYTD